MAELQAQLKEVRETAAEEKLALEAAHEEQRTEMNRLFENDREAMIETHGGEMRDQKESLITEKEDLRGRMQQKIDELMERLERELSNASGNAREIQERLQEEIKSLKQ